MPHNSETKLQSHTKVEGQKVEDIFTNFYQQRYLVNRRYQRKLVWSGEQKESLIDSIYHEIPIPLILLARSDKDTRQLEIIDGLQRIHAITSFIENEFAYEGKYFNLEAWGYTKLLRDKNEIAQKTPMLTQEQSVAISSYTIPVSIYESSSSTQVDKTFRRINSSGRQLGMQEVRQAGSISKIADLVRTISAEIRGDVSRSDIIGLREMKKNSLIWKQDGVSEGLLVDGIYWVKEGILRRDDLRSSKDEQLILDILLDILLDGSVASSTQSRDEAYDPSSSLSTNVQNAINVADYVDSLADRFHSILKTMSEVSKDGNGQESPWTIHSGKAINNSSGRYFLTAFVAFYELIYKENMALADRDHVTSQTRNYWKKDKIDAGGTWTAEAKKIAVQKFKGAIRGGFADDASATERGAEEDQQRLKSDFHKYASENRFYEIKVGFTDLAPHLRGESQPLSGRKEFFNKILKTATAMANTQPKAEGVIYFGIADKDRTVKQVEEKYGVSPLNIGDLGTSIPNKILGINHELDDLGVDLDQLLETLKSWTISNSSIDDTEWQKSLASSIRSILVRDASGHGRILVALYPQSGSKPVAFNNQYLERIGSANHQAEESIIVDLFRRYEEFQYRNR